MKTPQKLTTESMGMEAIISGWIDRRPWRWWDRIPITPKVHGKGLLSFFQVGMNMFDPFSEKRRTMADTNMTGCGQFNPPFCLMACQIGFQINAPDHVADRFYAPARMELRIMNKIMVESPLWRFTAGSGYIDPITGEAIPLRIKDEHIKTTPQGDAIVDQYYPNQKWQDGFPVPQAGVRISPLYIPPLTSFRLDLYFPDGVPEFSETFEVTAYLDGLTDLPVQ